MTEPLSAEEERRLRYIVDHQWPHDRSVRTTLRRLLVTLDRERETPPPASPRQGEPVRLDVERLTTVFYDWMPDGADVSLGFEGEGIHLTGGDLARYIFDRAAEAAALSEPAEAEQKETS